MLLVRFLHSAATVVVPGDEWTDTFDDAEAFVTVTSGSLLGVEKRSVVLRTTTPATRMAATAKPAHASLCRVPRCTGSRPRWKAHGSKGSNVYKAAVQSPPFRADRTPTLRARGLTEHDFHGEIDLASPSVPGFPSRDHRVRSPSDGTGRNSRKDRALVAHLHVRRGPVPPSLRQFVTYGDPLGRHSRTGPGGSSIEVAPGGQPHTPTLGRVLTVANEGRPYGREARLRVVQSEIICREATRWSNDSFERA